MVDVTCVICHNQINLGVNTNCHHHFCGKCILGWLTHCLVRGLESLTCPTCRVRVTHLQAEEEEGVVSHLTMTYNELYGGLHMQDNHEELQVAWLTDVRDTNGELVNHIDAMLPEDAPGPVIEIEQNDIRMSQIFAILFVVGAIVTSRLTRWT